LGRLRFHAWASAPAILGFTISLFVVGAVIPQKAAPATPPTALPQKAIPPADVLEYFSGDWSGKGKFTSGKELESDFSFAPDPESQWILVHQKEKPPQTFEFMALWSVDSVSGDLVMLMAGNQATGARLFHSHGWQEGKIVFQSVPELRSHFALERFAFERVSAAEFHSTYEMSFDDAKTWRVGDRQVFTKNSSH